MGCPLHGDACRPQTASREPVLEVASAAPASAAAPAAPVDMQLADARTFDEEVEIAQMQGAILAHLGAA